MFVVLLSGLFDFLLGKGIHFTLQIFFDFSGYSDMAIGMARVVGLRFVKNDTPVLIVLGLALSFLPALRPYDHLRTQVERSPRLTTALLALAAVLLSTALCRSASTTFQPFLYFRF